MKRSNWTVAAAVYFTIALFVGINKDRMPIAITSLLGYSTIIMWLFLPPIIMLGIGKTTESERRLHLRIDYLADQNEKLQEENTLLMDKLILIESKLTNEPVNPNPLRPQQETDDS